MTPLPIDAAQARKQQRARERRIWPAVAALRHAGYRVYRAGSGNEVILPRSAHARLLDDAALLVLAGSLQVAP